MREIKFRRAFFTDAEKTKFSHFDTWGVGVDNASFKSPGSNNFAIYFEDQQYTGLKDKNGKEIYEGDILKWLCSKSGLRKMKLYMVSINWRKEGHGYELTIFDNSEKWATGSSQWNKENREVIGNIYENPKLLQP